MQTLLKGTSMDGAGADFDDLRGLFAVLCLYSVFFCLFVCFLLTGKIKAGSDFWAIISLK